MNKISIALPKGRLAEDTLELLDKKGIADKNVVDFKSRKLIFEDTKNNINFLLIRNTDIPTYVEYGAADLGVVGKDILSESEANVYEFLDLGFGYCRLCSATLSANTAGYKHDMKVASKYSNLTKEYFARLGIPVEVIKLYGSIELAPIVGLVDYIVDLVSTGETMRKNGLVEVETIMESTARLIGNKSLTRAKHDKVKEIIRSLDEINV